MASYWIKTPWWVKKFFSSELSWSMPVDEEQPTVYLTFDDGPHPTITPFVLDQLARFEAKATFFCIGNNVAKHKETYEEVRRAGHAVGNHTFKHLNGWHTDNSSYQTDIKKASKLIDSNAFRPPYGRIKLSQVRSLKKRYPALKIYMWDVLSADFDTNITGEKCAENVLENIEPGSIVVFHDSEKAEERLRYALPLVLEHCKKMNWAMKALPQ